jgi:hypothetical protein
MNPYWQHPSATHEINRLIWNIETDYCDHKITLLDPITYMNPVQNLKPTPSA